jgi:hypothetical protein
MTKPQPFIGSSAKQSQVDEAIQALDSDEQLLGAFKGNPTRDGKTQVSLTSNNYLLVTDKRVIFWVRGVVSKSMDAFAFKDISSVDAHKGLLLGDIVINVKGAKEKVENMQKSDVDTASKMIRSLMESATTTQAARGGATIPDQIKKLAELRDAGILTEEEFSNKKTELLAKM